MKKNIFKKIVASLATVAMAAGMFAAKPAEEVKAAESKEVVVYLKDSSNVKKVLLDIHNWGGGSTLTPSGAVTKETAVSEWGRDLYEFTKDTENNDKWTIDVAGTMNTEAGEWCDVQIVVVLKDDTTWGGIFKVGPDDYKQANNELWNSNSVVYYSVDVTTNSWQDISASATDPTKKDPTATIKAINAIGTVELTDASNKKIKDAETAYDNFIAAGGTKAEVTNYDKLTAARAKYDELQKAEDAKFAGKVTIYVKNPGWDVVKLYAWNRSSSEIFGKYPGSDMTALKKNVGWYSGSFTIDKATNVLFGNGKEGGGDNQSADWNGLKAGTYWITLTEKGGDGKYVIAESNISTKAPTGWKDEEAKEIETQAPTTTPAPTTTKPAVDKGSVASKDDVAKIDAEAVVEGAPADAKLDATEIAADSDAFKVVKEAAKTAFKNKTYVALDLKLLKGTETVQANGDVKVTIPVPTALAKSTKVAVYRVGDDNKLVSCGTADVANGKITFTTNHFSTYVFADASVSGTKPGDAAPIVLMLAVAAVAAGMVVASKKKTICE